MVEIDLVEDLEEEVDLVVVLVEVEDEEEILEEVKDQNYSEQLVLSVAILVRCHSNLLEKDQFIVVIVLEIWNEEEMIEILEEEILATEEEVIDEIGDEEISEDVKRKECILQFVDNVVTIVRFHSSHLLINQFIVVIASLQMTNQNSKNKKN